MAPSLPALPGGSVSLSPAGARGTARPASSAPSKRRARTTADRCVWGLTAACVHGGKGAKERGSAQHRLACHVVVQMLFAEWSAPTPHGGLNVTRLPPYLPPYLPPPPKPPSSGAARGLMVCRRRAAVTSFSGHEAGARQQQGGQERGQGGRWGQGQGQGSRERRGRGLGQCWGLRESGREGEGKGKRRIQHVRGAAHACVGSAVLCCWTDAS